MHRSLQAAINAEMTKVHQELKNPPDYVYGQGWPEETQLNKSKTAINSLEREDQQKKTIGVQDPQQSYHPVSL